MATQIDSCLSVNAAMNGDTEKDRSRLVKRRGFGMLKPICIQHQSAMANVKSEHSIGAKSSTSSEMSDDDWSWNVDDSTPHDDHPVSNCTFEDLDGHQSDDSDASLETLPGEQEVINEAEDFHGKKRVAVWTGVSWYIHESFSPVEKHRVGKRRRMA
mmetsp:Transcript_28784/g.59002  ORF Transcript_28784/g.59002 Transcript_28784/m.59002 type:complete len:157 (+) Transcript_28784:106-576(+)